MRAGPLRPIARRALAAQSDERLVGLVREGHEPAFEEIVRRYRAPLVAFATAIVSHHRAEDVVQGSLEKAHRALLGEPKEIYLRPWLFAIVRNGSLNVIRDEPVSAELAPEVAGGTGPEAIAEQHEELDRLVTAICALPRAQREALVRREIDGAGHADIAAQLGTSATAVRGLIFRARTTLRDAVGVLVPLPLMRLLLAGGGPAGAATAGATGAGATGATVIGAAGAKGGLVVAAAVAALATGVAIERDTSIETPERAEAARVEALVEAVADRVDEPLEPSAFDGGHESEDDSGPGSDESGSGVATSGSETSGDSSGPGGGDGDSGDGGGDNLGPGDGDGSGSEGPGDGETLPPPLNDGSGHDGPGDGGGGSGPGPSGDDSSGPGSDGSDLPPPPPPDGDSGDGGGETLDGTLDDQAGPGGGDRDGETLDGSSSGPGSGSYAP